MSKKQPIKIYCTKCNGHTNHDVLCGTSKMFTPENTPGMVIDFAEGIWEILQCRGCEEVTFRETWTNSEDFDSETGVPEARVKLFPSRGEKLLPVKPHYNLTPTLRQVYRETIDCYNQGIGMLCAIGIRALIEGMCLDKGIKDGPILDNASAKVYRKENLQGKIEGLVEANLITPEQANTLHELRFLGNDAAHKLSAPSSDELYVAFEIVEHIIEGLYELQDKIQDLRRKKQLRPNPPAAT